MTRLFVLFILCLSVVQCGKNNDASVVTDVEYEETTNSSFEEFSNNLNLSATSLFVELCQSDQSDVNQVISPLSIQTAMAILLNGAHKNTANELKQFLNLESETIGGINSHFAELSKRILESNTASSYLSVSNAAIWNKDKITMNQNFLDRISDNYTAELLDHEFSVEGVNGWAENATDGLIKEVIQEIKPEEILFLLNALLFRSDWLTGFDEGLTQLITTELPSGSMTEYEMMSSDFDHYYFDDGEVQAVNMQFVDNAYEMIVVQPKTGSLDDFITQKGAQGLADLLSVLSKDAFSYNRIVLQFPKLEVKYKRNLNATLNTLGVADAFSEGVAKLDSLGLAQGNLFVTRVLHDTYLKVDEKGVEGAAVTTVGVGANSVPPIFTFDKPFFLCLRTSEDRIPIFMGKIGDPGTE